MPDPQKILVRGVNWLGDAVMTTPALQRLRKASLTGHIALLTHQKLADLWREHPALDQVITFAPRETVLEVSRRLRAEHFDIALLFPNSPRAALEAFLARIPVRIGFARPWRHFLLTRRVAPRREEIPTRKRSVREIKQLIRSGERASVAAAELPRESHHLYQYLSLVEALGPKAEPLPPHIAVSAKEVALIQERFQFSRAGGRPLFGLNAGAEYGPAKRWLLG